MRPHVTVDPRPRILDLFCGAGGAARGYQLAGFHVTGVDIKPQPRFAGDEFVQADALEYLATASGFDAIHASPPCQDHSPLKSVAGLHGTGWLLDATLEALAAQPLPWVVENVGAAHNRADFLLCGEMFGLRTIRHRRFTIDPRFNALLLMPSHPRHRRPTSTKKRRAALDAGHHISVTGDVGSYVGPLCMGIDWMTGDELSQAIPPAYTRFIGEQLLTTIGAAA
jgi:DNA (cytosine-5)-methyltransferase 1